MNGPWREPDEESVDLYPHLVVHDGRQSGSITFGRTRLPIWAPQWELVDLDDYAQPSDPQVEWQEAAESFVRHLLDLRGEFGRLLLVLADAERRENDREYAVIDEATGGRGGLVNITPGDPDAVDLPPAWWEDDDLKASVVEQLRRCLAVLERVTP
jgi:hypothetical protein